jgi:hypothetical protein
MSIKSGTRLKRFLSTSPIRKYISCGTVSQRKNWSNFVAYLENKSELAAFLCEEILKEKFCNVQVVIAGGFHYEQEVRSDPVMNTEPLRATHEEAHTRIILYAVNSECCR